MEPGTARRWSEAAILGIVVYVALDVALVFLRPHFSVLHSAESDYGSAGPYAWVMDVNFVLRCLLSLAAVGALVIVAGERARLSRGAGLLGVWALGSGALAFFPDDPAGTPTETAGRVHLVLATVSFVAVVAGSFVTGRALRADARYAPIRLPLLTLACAAVLALLALLHAGLSAHSLGGLDEKIFLGCELAWLGTVALWTARLSPGAS
jgi:hypothetical membrane protein